MKILAIGNSFSQDATRYIREIAKSNGDSFKAINLYIGACPLRKHYLNALQNKEAYEIHFDGLETGFTTSIQKALASDRWDVITLQQASKQSVNKETFFPYLTELIAYIKKYCPHTKIFIHETWAYEEGSEGLVNVLKYEHVQDMFKDVKASYQYAIKKVKPDGVIPSGTAMLNAYELGLKNGYRDGHHASLGAGRYLLALTWYKALTGNDISNNAFGDFDEEVSQECRKIIIEAVNKSF